MGPKDTSNAGFHVLPEVQPCSGQETKAFEGTKTKRKLGWKWKYIKLSVFWLFWECQKFEHLWQPRPPPKSLLASLNSFFKNRFFA